ncbi:MAG: hypothetical protein GY757_56455, partial [bacterium]|nr:hypothetical protein [bacterium]
SVAAYSIFAMTNFDLTLGIVLGEDISLDFTYLKEYFEEKTIKRLARHFTGILETALTNPADEITALEMVTREEKEQILYEFNEPGTTDIDNKTIHELFEEQVERTPNSIAALGIGTVKPVGKESLLNTLSTLSTQSTSSITSTQEIPLQESTYGALLTTAYHHPPTTSLIQLTYRELNKKANQLAQL